MVRGLELPNVRKAFGESGEFVRTPPVREVSKPHRAWLLRNDWTAAISSIALSTVVVRVWQSGPQLRRDGHF